jgi:hypothetical protein
MRNWSRWAKLGHQSIFKTSPPTGYDRNGTHTYIQSTPRDETSVWLIADQGLVEQLGYQIVEEKSNSARNPVLFPASRFSGT